MRRQRGGNVWLGVWAVCGALWCAAPAWSQQRLPGPDAAAWLEEAGVQARRVTGVGDQLTTALQVKGELLAAVAAYQDQLGQADAAEKNRRVVGLCVRALSHDGEDGWVRATRAWALGQTGRADAARAALGAIQNSDERAWAAVRLEALLAHDNASAIPRVATAGGLSPGFLSQVETADVRNQTRGRAAQIVREQSLADAVDFIDGLELPARRAFAALGVAEALLDPKTQHVVAASPSPEPASEVASEAVEETVPEEAVSAAEPGPATVVEAVTIPKVVVVAPGVEARPDTVASEPVAPEGEAEEVAASAEAASRGTDASADAASMTTQDNSTDQPADENSTAEADVTQLPAEMLADESAGATDPRELEPEVAQVDAAAEAAEPSPETATDVAVDVAADTAPPAAALILPDLKVLADPAAVLDDAPAPDTFDVTFVTTKGPFTVRVERAWAPGAADRFHDLVTAGFYHNQRFFRIVPGFVVQWGIHGYPAVAKAWRTTTFDDETRTQPNARGTVAFAAAATPNTRTTQVFVNLGDNAYLDELGFAPFGRVTDGLDVAEQLFDGYGETPSEEQREIQLRGNIYLDTRFPELDSIVSVEVK